MSSQIAFEADDKPLKDVLFSNRKFRVPRYQRPYAWGVEETSELWEDLASGDEAHFLGSFIFNTGSEDEGYVEIIDGQQRLLTVTIVAAVLRDLAKQLDVVKAGIFHRHDIAIEDRDGAQSFRILPAESIKDYFLGHIQKGDVDILLSSPTTPEEKRIKENYRFIHQRVSEVLAREPGTNQKIALLDQLRKKIEDMIVISIEITKEEDAYEIFETTNARGLELSVADLLKNLIFKNIPVREDLDLAKDTWKEITEDIQSTNAELTKFIRYFWISKYRFVSEKQLFREIKKTIKDKGWDLLLDDLWKNSTLYNKLLVGGEQEFHEISGIKDLKQRGAEVYQAIFALRLMGVSQCHVLLLSILRNLPRLGTNPTRFIQLIERFSFQYSAICKQPTNRLEKIYSKYAIEIEKAVANTPDKHVAGKIQSIFARLESDLRNEAPSVQVFKESFAEISYRSSEASRLLVKYILDRINAHLQKTDENRPDFNAVNIEHLLPRNPQKGSDLKREEIKPYVNKLGNLTLLSQKINSRLQNAAPKQKLPELETSELAITKDLVESLKKHAGEWGECQIKERHDRMAELAYWQIWRLVK